MRHENSSKNNLSIIGYFFQNLDYKQLSVDVYFEKTNIETLKKSLKSDFRKVLYKLNSYGVEIEAC